MRGSSLSARASVGARAGASASAGAASSTERLVSVMSVLSIMEAGIGCKRALREGVSSPGEHDAAESLQRVPEVAGWQAGHGAAGGLGGGAGRVDRRGGKRGRGLHEAQPLHGGAAEMGVDALDQLRRD